MWQHKPQPPVLARPSRGFPVPGATPAPFAWWHRWSRNSSKRHAPYTREPSWREAARRALRAFPTSRAGTLAPQGALARPAPPTPPSSSMAPGTTSSTRTKHGCRRGIARVQDGASRRCFVRIGFKMVASPPRALLPGSKMPSSTSPTCLASCPAPQRP